MIKNSKMNTNIYKKILIYCCIGIFMFTQYSCKDGLDYENENTIVPDAVWKNAAMINAFFTDIHGGLNPGWTFNGESSDEAASGPRSMGSYLRGMITVDNSSVSLNYTYVDKINFFLENLDNVTADVMSEQEKDLLAGQAKFWRAWTYWGMVKNVGGVPLILNSQNAHDKESLYHERNKTSECVTQILKDLDDAIAVLPGRYADEDKDYGRITKAAAMSFKGKILMFLASPLFNPENDSKSWQTAYTANKEAIALLDKEGYGLYPDFKQLWYDERNKEVIMVNQYFYPGHTMGTYPSPSVWSANQPLLSLLLAFPKKDGSYLTIEQERLKNDSEYNQAFMKDFYMNRDDRFYTTIYFGGIPYPSEQLIGSFTKETTLWHAWKYNEAEKYYDKLLLDFNFIGDPGFTGFTQLKGMDKSLTYEVSRNGQTDWIEMRYAEVLMNLGECANEIGKSDEALQILYDIRKRAGIEAGSDGRYGLSANETSEIREAYIKERQAEFAYEGKRFDDLRRWKRFDIMNEQGARHGLYLVLKPDAPLPTMQQTILDPEVRKNFRMDYIDNLDGDSKYYFNLDLEHWFYPLNPNQISQSLGKLEQNKEWGGSFDPLQ